MIFDKSLSVIIIIIMITVFLCIIPILYIIDKKVDDLTNVFWQKYYENEKDIWGEKDEN